jgi:hypothetical protein
MEVQPDFSWITGNTAHIIPRAILPDPLQFAEKRLVPCISVIRRWRIRSEKETIGELVFTRKACRI